MRTTRTEQPSVFQAPQIDHTVGDELEVASLLLDRHPELLDMVGRCVGGSATCGRIGLTCETILRCAVIARLMDFSYRGLEFALHDSAAARRFARIDPWRVPKKSALQSAISMIDAKTWEQLDRVLLQEAKERGIEAGTQVRIDSTVSATDILEPSDSRLLYDGVRVLTRLLRQARELMPKLEFSDHRRAAKRLDRQIDSARAAKGRRRGYQRLLALVARTLGYAAAARALMDAVTDPWAESWCAELDAYVALIERVVDQTKRRVFDEEKVPAAEKVVSLFEPHTDIIVKGGRATQYGHKINLSTGRSGLVLDVVVEAGNPADSTRCLPMLRRHVEAFGEPPQRAAFDGGYASKQNLSDAKELGVEHVVFHKKSGLEPADMTPSSWIHDQLKRFRAGVEAGISYLKRCFGLGRCNWHGWEHFQAYVHAAVFAHNLIRLARLLRA